MFFIVGQGNCAARLSEHHQPGGRSNERDALSRGAENDDPDENQAPWLQSASSEWLNNSSEIFHEPHT